MVADYYVKRLPTGPWLTVRPSEEVPTLPDGRSPYATSPGDSGVSGIRRLTGPGSGAPGPEERMLVTAGYRRGVGAYKGTS